MPTRIAAIAVALFALPLAAQAQVSAAPSTAPNEAVARTFIAATQAQDRKAALNLLDEKVSIQFPGSSGHGEGQPFVIGYLDGLFYGQRAVSLEGGDLDRGGAVRFLAYDASRHDHYAIDVEVKDQHVVRVTVRIEPETATHQAVAALDPS
jgi:hypothetical protein